MHKLPELHDPAHCLIVAHDLHTVLGMIALPRFRRLPRKIVAAPIRPYGGPWNASDAGPSSYEPQPITLDGKVWEPEFCDPEATTREINYNTEEL